MSFFKRKSHKQRVENVKEYMSQNKIFVVIIIVIFIGLTANFVGNVIEKFNKKSDTGVTISEPITPQETQPAETTEPFVNVKKYQEEENLKWSFHWIDLWILVGGGGFCGIMIYRERKARKQNM